MSPGWRPAGELTLDERRDFGVVLGSGGAGLEFTDPAVPRVLPGRPKSVSLYTIPSSTPGAISSELSMRFELRGPSHVLSTGCTSSTDALGHALSLIRYGRASNACSAAAADAPIDSGHPDRVLPAARS